MKVQNVAILGAVATVVIAGSVFAAQSEEVLKLKDDVKEVITSSTYIDKASKMLGTTEDIKIEEVLNKHQAIYTSDTIGSSTVAAHMETFLNLNKGKDGKHNISYNGLMRDELNIPLEGKEGAYISNMALVGNVLHIQLRSETEEGTGTINLVNQEKMIFNDNKNKAQLVLSSGTDGSTYSEFIFYIENPEDIGDYKIVVK